MKKNRTKIQSMTMISLMAALLCIIGPITIPIGMIPASMTIAVLYLMIYILGTWKAAVSCMIYLCIGFIGLPVYSGYTGGAASILGPTGGYLIGYLMLVACSGFFIDRFQNKLLHLFGMSLGLLLCYCVGTLWLTFQAEMTIRQAILTGIVPFVLFDILKIIAVLFIGPLFRRQMYKAGLMNE